MSPEPQAPDEPRSEYFPLRIEPTLLRAIDEEARALGMDRSALVRYVLRQSLPAAGGSGVGSYLPAAAIAKIRAAVFGVVTTTLMIGAWTFGTLLPL